MRLLRLFSHGQHLLPRKAQHCIPLFAHPPLTIPRAIMTSSSSSSSHSPSHTPDISPTTGLATPKAAKQEEEVGSGSGGKKVFAIDDKPAVSSSTTTSLDVSTGEAVKLDQLGPVVVNADGTISRIGEFLFFLPSSVCMHSFAVLFCFELFYRGGGGGE